MPAEEQCLVGQRNLDQRTRSCTALAWLRMPDPQDSFGKQSDAESGPRLELATGDGLQSSLDLGQHILHLLLTVVTLG